MDQTRRLLRRPLDGDDRGFTLIELLVGMVIMTTLISLSVTGWTRYQRVVEHSNAADKLVSALRNAQQRSLTEAATYCVSFDAAARTYRVFKFACGASGTPAGGAVTLGNRLTLLNPSFTQVSGGTAASVSFLPRGSATKGSVQIGRKSGGKTYIIAVEGLTGRVSLTG